ncbi:uracil-DNA glycosylase family protein [Parasphingorhabdus sp.]|uniref:uracil-DNA glycosylase family protein n=1 Tax=Parasphingorhabdus sp. TaxID=2709688 RepID=UPI003A908971
MNLIASSTANPSTEAMVHSLQNWWSLAGVELDYADLPAPLLTEKSVPTAPVAIPREPAHIPQVAVTEPAPENDITPVAEEPLPASHAQFVDWLANSDRLIEANWSQKTVLPTGVLEPEIMVISALPEKVGNGDIALFNPQNQKLLDKMLAAIGCDSQQAYLATIAIAASIDGRIDEQYWSSFKKRLLHHIGLVRPKRIICFGDLAAKIIFDEDLLSARKNKQFINHSASKTEAIVTFHPRILIERPLFKAEAWKDLQMLTRISAP